MVDIFYRDSKPAYRPPNWSGVRIVSVLENIAVKFLLGGFLLGNNLDGYGIFSFDFAYDGQQAVQLIDGMYVPFYQKNDNNRTYRGIGVFLPMVQAT
ncbi:MAG: hypothetical protein ACR2NY_02030 [Alphaproteobacteria bacterium]